MTFAMPVKMKWVEATDQWHMVTMPNEVLLQEFDFFNCSNIARIFPGLDKTKVNKFIVKITRVEDPGGDLPEA